MRATEFTKYQPPELEVGDKILKGKFKNSPAEIKGFTKDKHNQPVLKTNKGEVQLFKPRVVKLMPKKLDELNVDNVKGIGATPNNQEIDYFGLRVQMAPTTFLELAAGLGATDPEIEKRILSMAEYIKGGGAIGAPMLIIDIPDDWEQGDLSPAAKIVGHEGRHRMNAILKAENNNPVEVHLTFPGFRHRDLTPEWIKRLNMSIVTEYGTQMRGPLFK